MDRRLLPNPFLHLLSLMIIACVTLPILGTAYATQPYPPMVSGEKTGSVTGKIMTNTSAAMPGVAIYIVNSADTGIVYASGYTNGNGDYTFAGVNSTNGSPVYRLYVTASGYDNTSSSPFSVSSTTTSTVNVIMTRNYSIPTATPTPTPRPGDISGHVLVNNTSKAVPNALVSLVKADNRYVPLSKTNTDNNGYFSFSGVAYLTSPGYELRIEKDGYDEGFTLPFQIASGSTVTIDIYLTPSTPADTSGGATATPTQSPTAKPSATATPQANSGLPSIPGFEAILTLAGIIAAIACTTRGRT